MSDHTHNMRQQKLRNRNKALLIGLFAIVIILYSLAIVRMKGIF